VPSSQVIVSSGDRVLVLYEHGRAGAAAIDLARELAEAEDAEVTVVGVAPRAPSLRCVSSAADYDQAVADSVARDLERARQRLGPAAAHARFRMLTEGADPSFGQFARTGGFDLVLLPGHRRPFGGAHHPEARRLALNDGGQVRIVDPVSGVLPRSPRRDAGAG
jgi:hypothetical protein